MESIVVVDDDDFFRNRLSKALEKRGFTAYAAANYEEAMATIRQHSPSLAIVDLKMPGKSGLDLIRDLQRENHPIRIVVLTGYGSISTAVDAVKLGAVSYISKPADVDEILRAFQAPERPEEEAIYQDDIQVPSLARAEWEHINRVLQECGGNITKTAEKLGIHRRSLQRKLLKFPPMI